MNQLTAKAKVTEGGRIVIPALMRKALGIKVGKNVTLVLDDQGLRVSTRESALRRIDELMKDKIDPNRSVVDEFIRERREEAANE
jgi:AbrB family looped-hinge helix DNA binding protein